MVSRTRRWLVLGLALALSGCLSPTIPLPPPSRPEIEGPTGGVVILSGRAPGESAVFALNQRTTDIRGQLTGSDGLYRIALPAEVGDAVTLWYSLNAEVSSTAEFVIRAPSAGAGGVEGQGGAASSAAGLAGMGGGG